MADLTDLLTGGVVGLAVSDASAAVVEPALEPARQEANKAVKARIHELPELAQAVAQALLTVDQVTEDAKRNGFPADGLNLSIQLALRAPGVPEALNLYRRRTLDGVDDATALARLHHSFAKAQIEYQYWPQLVKTARVPLDPAVIALGIVRSTVADPGLQVGAHPTEGADIETFPLYPGDALTEAAASGIDEDELRVMVGNVGLPMPPVRAASAYFRNIINLASYYLSVAQSDARPAWADAILEEARQILTAHDHVELRLRGWYETDQQMYDGTAEHGMSTENTDKLFKVLGRPMTHHQVFLAERRGGVYDGPTDQIDAPFLKSLRESNERPEWYNLEWAYRFTQPSAFVIRQYLKDGGDPAWAQEKLWFEGWEQSDIDKFISEYSGGATASASTHVKSASTAAVTAIKKWYLGGGHTPAEAETFLVQAGETASDAGKIVQQWNLIAQLEGVNIDTAGGTPH